MLENPKAPVEVDKLLTSLLSNSEVPSSEISEIKKLISVFNASVDFWNVPFQDDTLQSKIKCNPKHQQYLADICGCMFGGVGAIAYSWLIEEMQQQHGGGCI